MPRKASGKSKSKPPRKNGGALVRDFRKPVRPYPGLGMGGSVRMRHAYATQVTIDAPSGGLSFHTFSCNGLYDPDITGIGHQPYGFDQMAARFAHYKVIESAIDAWPIISVDGGSSPMCVIARTAAATPPFSDVYHLLESPSVSRPILGARYDITGIYDADHVEMDFRLKRDLLTKDNSAQVVGSNAANPVEQSYFQVYVGALTAENPGPLTFVIRMFFEAIWSEEEILAQS